MRKVVGVPEHVPEAHVRLCRYVPVRNQVKIAVADGDWHIEGLQLSSPNYFFFFVAHVPLAFQLMEVVSFPLDTTLEDANFISCYTVYNVALQLADANGVFEDVCGLERVSVPCLWR